MLHHTWGYASDKRLRDENQDHFGVFEFPKFTLAVVCDGMGGHVGGAQASALAVRTIHDAMEELSDQPLAEALKEAVTRANYEIYQASHKHRRFMGMGTTVVAVALEGNTAHVAHVGDSRLYAIVGEDVVQLTTDHTMVNLFVEAELLSPEDAAAHPEAHVLARSLGVEKTVEVDLAEPLELDPGHILLLCTDGVHGAIDDTQVGMLDWSDLQEGCNRILRAVADAEGDDNASVVVVGLDIRTTPRIPPTPTPLPISFDKDAPPPQPPDSGQAGRDSGSAAIQIAPARPAEPSLPARRETILPMATPEPAPSRPERKDEGVIGAGVPQRIAPPEPDRLTPEERPKAATDTPQISAPMLMEEVDESIYEQAPSSKPPTSVAITADGAFEAKKKTPAAARDKVLTPEQVSARRTRSRLVFGGLAATMMLALGVFGATKLLGSDSSPTEKVESELAFETPDVPIGPVFALDTDDSGKATDDTDADALTSRWIYSPELPPSPRLAPHRARLYVQPPPGGPLQLEAVKSARDGNCTRSLDAIRRAMRDSIDFASLYPQAWDCFSFEHFTPLSRAEATTLAEFREVIPHFEGEYLDDPAVEVPAKELEKRRARERIVYWYRPSIGGIEYRIEAWLDSGEVDLLTEVMIDRAGREKIADQLMRDLTLEAQAAAGLAGVQRHNPESTQWWARRVYVTTRAMKGSVGVLVAEEFPEEAAKIESLLDEATDDAYSDPTRAELLPRPVRDALRTGLGLQEGPSAVKVAVRPVPKPAPEPDPDTDEEPTDLTPTIHRHGP